MVGPILHTMFSNNGCDVLAMCRHLGTSLHHAYGFGQPQSKAAERKHGCTDTRMPG